MIKSLSVKDKKVTSTEISNFFNNAKSAQKKKVFEKVLLGASRRQEQILANSPSVSN